MINVENVSAKIRRGYLLLTYRYDDGITFKRHIYRPINMNAVAQLINNHQDELRQLNNFIEDNLK